MDPLTNQTSSFGIELTTMTGVPVSPEKDVILSIVLSENFTHKKIVRI